jgi:hypothetical protein
VVLGQRRQKRKEKKRRKELSVPQQDQSDVEIDARLFVVRQRRLIDDMITQS